MKWLFIHFILVMSLAFSEDVFMGKGDLSFLDGSKVKDVEVVIKCNKKRSFLFEYDEDDEKGEFPELFMRTYGKGEVIIKKNGNPEKYPLYITQYPDESNGLRGFFLIGDSVCPIDIEVYKENSPFAITVPGLIKYTISGEFGKTKFN